jgi:DNA-binding PucR family transcriptional regulator
MVLIKLVLIFNKRNTNTAQFLRAVFTHSIVEFTRSQRSAHKRPIGAHLSHSGPSAAVLFQSLIYYFKNFCNSVIK